MTKLVWLFAGIIVGAVAALVGISPRLHVGRETVLQCRRQVAVIAAWSPEDKARFWANVQETPGETERWMVIRTIASIPVAEKTPEKAL